MNYLPLAVMGAPAISLQKHLSLQVAAGEIVAALEKELAQYQERHQISKELPVLCQHAKRLVSELQNSQQLVALAAPIEGCLRLFPNELRCIQRARLQIAQKLESADLYPSAISIYADLIRKLSNQSPEDNKLLKIALNRLLILSRRPLFDMANQIAMRELKKLATIKACPAFRFHYLLSCCLETGDLESASTTAWQIIADDAKHKAPYPNAEIAIKILEERCGFSKDIDNCLARVKRQFPKVIRSYMQSLRRQPLPTIYEGDENG